MALVIVPVVLDRSGALTRKKIIASMPLSLDEIQALTDKARAEAALSVRRLEITAKSLKEKSNAQMVEVSRSREEIKRLGVEMATKVQSIGKLEAQTAELKADLDERSGQVSHLSSQLGAAEDLIEQKNEELHHLAKAHEEVSLISSGRQIEIAGRESEIERMSTDNSRLRAAVREIEDKLRISDDTTEHHLYALKTQTKRVADLEKKIEKMLSKLTDREEKLERRERELAQLRQERANAVPFAEAPGRSRVALAGSPGELDVNRQAAERDRLEVRLTALTRENKKLRAQNAADASPPPIAFGGAALREEIHQLAAQVVKLAANLDDPNSPIKKTLATRPALPGNAPGSTLSLAERVRALQKAASST
ncbi:hypothetical protein GA830_00255 [Mesorhizobium sp. NBSH29]|uniref:hypothetical protein n=1 Tax=Mesorhizobium sp. NBSH29 TaxID=2654249 RepID=UPI00189646DF|nr:hypothetical protein [Mesorhizobium sp. NBSH29]QPC85344.1 hypothetical protein GA830_00255 [Mesorhizobium sp. NBSH29]